MTDGAQYAELHCHSYFSLLDGASAPEDLATQATELGLRGLALTDHDSLAGAVRFAIGARQAGLHALFGAEVTLVDGAHLTLLAETQAGYANLCQLITRSRLDHVPPAGAGEVAWQVRSLTVAVRMRGLPGRARSSRHCAGNGWQPTAPA